MAFLLAGDRKNRDHDREDVYLRAAAIESGRSDGVRAVYD